MKELALESSYETLRAVVWDNVQNPKGTIQIAHGLVEYHGRYNDLANFLNKKLSKLKGLIIPKVQKGCTHSYYMYKMRIDKNITKVSRDVIFEALKAEGVPNISKTYQNLHLLPMFQKKIAYGNKHFPWSYKYSRKNISYKKGICPNAELLNDKEYLGFEMCKSNLSSKELKIFIKAFYKVWDNLTLLRKYKKK